ncbi:MAG: PHP-associated domain-containing protein [Candidatus Nanoarchaeia archaeon]|nr:PHP-associated domain-containing protein [Candidatus Nanoarchaeia archaeon]
MKKCDIHVHSEGSDMLIGINFTKMCGVRECYSSPEDIYNLAISRGMDYVTITDHNRIDKSIYLVEKIDKKKCFTGCEYTVSYPETGHKLDVVCLGHTEKQHNDLLMLRKTGLKEFLAYVQENKIPHTLAHPAWPVENKPKLSHEVVIEWINMFNVIEVINADLERANDIAKRLVKAKGYKTIDEKGMRILGTTGGSDAHILSGIARGYTVAPNARSKDGFLEAVLKGEVYGEGEYSSLELFHSQIQEGIHAFVRHEFQNIKQEGLRNYAKKNPTKAAYITLVPILRHIIPAAIARNLKTKLEEQAYSLEKKCIDSILNKEFKEEMMGIYQRIYARKSELEENIKAPGYYLPPLSGIWATVIEKIREKWDLTNADYSTTND